MFDTLSSRSLRAMCMALCLAAFPLSGCPEEEEDDQNNEPTSDMAVAVQDMTTVRDMGMSASDLGGALDASTPGDMPRVELDLDEPADAGEPDAGELDAGEPDAGSPDLGDEDMSVSDLGAEDLGVEDMPQDLGAEDLGAEDLGAEDMSVEDMPQDMEAPDVGSADMPGDMMSDAGVDMAPTTCSVGVPRCFLNDDCTDASTRCDADASGIACCLPGPRGVEPPGTPCLEGNDCDSSLCIGDGQGGLTYCSKTCTSDSECVAQLPRCNPAFGICVPSN